MVRGRGQARRGRLVAAAVTVAVLLAACGSDDPASGAEATSPAAAAAEPAADAAATTGETRFTVVVPDAPIADLVRKVAGPGVEVSTLVPVGADGHTYQPTPADARALATADLYIENGMELNVALTEFALTNYAPGTPHHLLADVIPDDEVISSDSPEDIAAHGHAHNFNAHFWPNPAYAMLYVSRITEILAAHDIDNASEYQERGAALNRQINAMDAAFTTALATIPEANRKLVVYHDSWSYFGRRYDLPVVGAIQPTDFSEPSAAELRATIEQVRAEGVPAFFGSEVFPSDVLETIAGETGATYVADLSDDRLPGELGSPEHSYVGMMVANVRTIVSALGGDPSALDAVPLAP